MTVKDAAGRQVFPILGKLRVAIPFLACFLLGSLGWSQTITSRVDPQVLAKGQRGNYQVTIKGISNPQNLGGAIPKVPGITISPSASTSTQTQIINGAISKSVTYSFPLSGDTLGTFTIPKWEISFGNKAFDVPVATVKVVDSKEVYSDIFDLDLHLDKKEFYVGERVTGKLMVLVRDGVDARLGGPPEKIGDGFVQDKLEERPWKIGSTSKGGIRYQMAQAELAFTAIKAGQQSLQYKVPISLRIQGNNNNFRDPFFDDFFPGRRSFRELTLETEPKQWEVKPLPTEGKPDNFSGAVGNFTASVTFSPKQVSVGEPVTLKLQLSGTGNFDRIQAPKIENTENHKVYPPKIGFVQDNLNSSGAGTKTFEYIVIPQHEKADTLMEIPFFYFDPGQRIYVDRTQRPGKMVVLPAPEGTFSPGGDEPIVRAASPLTGQEGNKETLRLLPIQTESRGWKRTGEISIWTPSYIGVQAASFALMAGILIIRRRQLRFAGDSSLRRQVTGSKQARAWKKKSQDAMARGDANAFLEAACRTLQVSVSKEQSALEAVALTFADIRLHLEAKGVPGDAIQHAKAIFDAADQVKFAGGISSGLDLEGLNNSLETALGALK
jgi:hypothetical protein